MIFTSKVKVKVEAKSNITDLPSTRLWPVYGEVSRNIAGNQPQGKSRGHSHDYNQWSQHCQ